MLGQLRMKATPLLVLVFTLFLGACGDEGGSPAGPLADGGGPNGCPSYRDIPVAAPGDDIGGHNYANFAGPFFSNNCVRCHGSTRMGDDRHGAPVDVLLDVESSVRANLLRIRDVLGESNYMPFDNPSLITCEQRRTMLEWIDVGAP